MISHWTGLSLLQRTTDFFCKFCQYSFFYFIFAMHWRTCVLYQVEAYLHGNTKKAWLCFLGICKTTIWWKVQKLLYYTPVFLFFSLILSLIWSLSFPTPLTLLVFKLEVQEMACCMSLPDFCHPCHWNECPCPSLAGTERAHQNIVAEMKVNWEW